MALSFYLKYFLLEGKGGGGVMRRYEKNVFVLKFRQS